MKQPVHLAEMKELFGKLGINLLKQFAELPRFQELSQVKKEENEEALPVVEIWNSSVSLQGKIAGLWAHLSGRAPFFKTEEVVVSADGHAWLIHKEDFASAAESMKEAKAVVVEDSKVFLESDFPTENIPFFDISLAAYLLDPTRVTYPLSYIAGLFGKPVIYPDDLDDRKEKGCCITLFLASLYEEAVKKLSENGVLSLFQKVEQPLVPVLAAMEKAGIATDQEKWRAVKEEMEKEERILMKDIFTEAGEAFNLNSPKQLGHILFEKMGMPAGKKTKTGYSTAADVLEELAVSYPMVKNILRYRTLSKLVSTYLEALPQLINPETGRIHTSFNQTVTATGRLSSSDPNLQNIPVRTEEGRKSAPSSCREKAMTASFPPIIPRWNFACWPICREMKA